MYLAAATFGLYQVTIINGSIDCDRESDILLSQLDIAHTVISPS